MTDNLRQKVDIANAMTRVRKMPPEERETEFNNLAYHLINMQESADVPVKR
jgi:hypothetical protein